MIRFYDTDLEGIFKEENNHLYITVMQQWLDIDELIERKLQTLSLHPVPIEGFPETVEGYREKAHSWAISKLSWPNAINKYLYDEPSGLNDDVFTDALDQRDNDSEQQESPRTVN